MPVSGYWTYTIAGSDCLIDDYDNSGGYNVTIPETLDGYNVIEISANALKSKSLTDVTFDHQVTLRNECFANNGSLNVTINANLLSNISNYNYAPFEGCTVSLTISEGVTSIPSLILAHCGLSGSITLPSTLTSIGAYSFYWNIYITTVNLPSALTSIGDYAFAYCTGMTSITFNYATDLGDNTFANCGSIIVNLNVNITTTQCASSSTGPFETDTLTLNIGNSVTTIANNLFAGASISSLDLNQVTTIGVSSFYYCGLTEVILPITVSSVGAYAFAYNANLEDFYVYHISCSFGSNCLLGNKSAGDHGTIYGESGSTAEALAAAYAYYDFSTFATSVTVTLTKSNIDIAGKTLGIKISNLITLTKSNIYLYGKNINIKIDNLITLSKSNIQLSGQNIIFKVNNTINLTKSNIQLSGKTISFKIDSIIDLIKTNIQISGNDIEAEILINVYTALWENQKVLYNTLSADTTFMNLISNRLYDSLPTNTNYPYVYFGKPTEIPWNNLNRIGFEDTFTLFIFTKPKGLGWYTAYTILDSMNSLLNVKRLSMNNLYLIWCKLDNVMKEKEDDKRILHVRYRIWNQSKVLNT